MIINFTEKLSSFTIGTIYNNKSDYLEAFIHLNRVIMNKIV
jgi:hypothetical protein